MTIKNAKNVSLDNLNFLQIDDRAIIKEVECGTILKSSDAWEKFSWTHKYFVRKPKQGYFIWIKKNSNTSLNLCFKLASNYFQDLKNLLFIDSNIKAKANSSCFAKKYGSKGRHYSNGKIVLKKGASLSLNVSHKWEKDNDVVTDYQFFLEKDSKVKYNFKDLKAPKSLKIKTSVFEKENSSFDSSSFIDCKNTILKLKEKVFLQENNSQAILRLRVVGRKKSQISAISSIECISKSRGHLDCQSLLADKNIDISLIPKLVCKNKDSQLTHEASIGKISSEQFDYLKSRGFSNNEAIDLIIKGFLKI